MNPFLRQNLFRLGADSSFKLGGKCVLLHDCCGVGVTGGSQYMQDAIVWDQEWGRPLGAQHYRIGVCHGSEIRRCISISAVVFL